MKSSKDLKGLTLAEVIELSKNIPVTERASTFTMDGPGAWPGGGTLSPDCWYYTQHNPGSWQYSDTEVGVWFYNSYEYIHYITKNKDGDLIQIRWTGYEED